MNQANDTARPDPVVGSGRFPATDMPTRLLLLLVALGLPRTVLADLDLVPPESGPLYYVLALTPFAAWLLVATVRESRRPFADFLVLGILYGLSLAVAHQVLWNAAAGYGQSPPADAVEFAERFGAGWHEFAFRAYTSGIAMSIGLGTGLVAALVAVGARVWRSHRAH